MTTPPAGPYFPGQVSSSRCGHFYPDVMRMFDFRGETDVCWRVCYCGVCKRQFRTKIHEIAFGLDHGVLVSEFEQRREEAMKRLKERNCGGQ
jgi:hypothetical protein